MAVNGCPVCLEKQRRIDELEEEVQRLRTKVRYQERKEKDGFFGSSTPSSKKPVKPNVELKESKPRGAKPGHNGVHPTFLQKITLTYYTPNPVAEGVGIPGEKS